MLVLKIDIKSLEDEVYQFTSQMKAVTERSIQMLAAQTHRFY